MYRRFRAGDPPFDGDVAWTEHLPLEVGRRALALAIDTLADRFPEAALVASDDWHEHDGVVLPGWETTWDELRQVVASEQALAAASPGDTHVFRACRDRDGRFLLRFIVEEGPGGPSDALEVGIDLAADPDTLDRWAARWVDLPSRTPALPWFERRAAGSLADRGPSVHTWLAEVRRRPAMYVTGRDPLGQLETLVHGYDAASWVHGLVDEGPAMHHFGEWLRFTRGWSWSSGWALAIKRRRAGGSDALSRFFGLWDEYRALRPRTIGSLVVPPGHWPPDGLRTLRLAERPDLVELRRYWPSPLLHLRGHVADRRYNGPLLWDAHLRLGATTPDQARAVTAAALGVPSDAWTVSDARPATAPW